MNQAVIDHLSSDPVLKVLIDTHGRLNYPKSELFFQSIVSTIISQQLSVKAAATIQSRFYGLFPDSLASPQLIISLDPDIIRQTGISYPKITYLKDLSNKVLSGQLILKDLDQLTDEVIVSQLTTVKGIGRWTAEMLLMFDLQRPDILPLDDVGIQNAFVKLYGLNRKHKSLSLKMLKIAEPWRPYRTFACWYLWKCLDNTPN